MVIRAEMVEALGEFSRAHFISRVCAMIRQELPEFQPMPDAELSALTERAVGQAELGGIVEEQSVAEYALLSSSWSAITGRIDPPSWFDTTLRKEDLDAEGKLAELRDRSRYEVLAYADIIDA